MAAWRFLLDENVDPKVAAHLENEEAVAEHVRDALAEGADDETDVLPYAREHGLIVVTSDVTDFGDIPIEDHAGLTLLYDDTMPAYRVAAALIALVDAYPETGRVSGNRGTRRLDVTTRATATPPPPRP